MNMHAPKPIEYEYHPLADIFPMLDGGALKELADDIRENGLQQLIDIYEGFGGAPPLPRMH
jgi:hypothetical protein